jgi:hypothetical protein
MAEIIQQRVSRIRWALELLLSLDFAWLIVWTERVRSKALGGYYGDFFIKRLYRTLRVDINEGQTVLEQIVWCLGLAVVVFLLLRVLSRFTAVPVALRRWGGVFAVAGFPVVALLFPLGFLEANRLAGVYKVAWAAEVVIVLTYGFFYSRNRQTSSSLFTVLVFLHFALWAWATEGYIDLLSFSRAPQHIPSNLHPWLGLWFSMFFHFGAPLISLLAALTWSRYVRCPLETYTPNKVSTEPTSVAE